MKTVEERRQYLKEWRNKNKDYFKRYYAKNKKSVKAIQRRSYALHRENILRKKREMYHASKNVQIAEP